MSSAKDVKKKIVILKESSLAEIQSLLEEEAKNGWFFVEKKACIYYFEKGKGRKLKFRLLPNDERPSQKEIDRYKQDEWEYVGNMSRTAIFCGKLSAKEIKIQPKKTSDIVSKLKSEISFQVGFIFVIAVLAIISWVAVTFGHGYFWKNMMDNWNSNFSIPLVYLSLIIISVILLIDKIDFYKAFKKVPICQNGNIKKKKTLLITRTIFSVILSVVAVTVFFITLCSMLNGVNSRDCTKYKGKTMVALMDVEEIDEFYTQSQYDNLGMVKSVNTTPVYNGVYSVASTLMCEEHLEWEENLECEALKYGASLKGEYYKIKSTKIAKSLYKEIIDKLNKDIEKNKILVDIIPEKKYKEYKFEQMKVMIIDGEYNVLIREKNEIYNIKFKGENDYKKVLEYIGNNFKKRELGL